MLNMRCPSPVALPLCGVPNSPAEWAQARERLLPVRQPPAGTEALSLAA